MAGPAASENQNFCFKDELDAFKLSLSPNKEVILEHYLAGWSGLVKWVSFLFLEGGGSNILAGRSLTFKADLKK